MIKTVYQSSGSDSFLHFLEIFKSTKIGFGLKSFSAKSNRHSPVWAQNFQLRNRENQVLEEDSWYLLQQSILSFFVYN
ncbi:hypothetical protein V6Z11_A09G012500 [Gossypium hirsutum]